MTSTTQIGPTGRDARVPASTASWITPGMKINGLLAVPKHLETFTTGNCQRKDSSACKKVVVSKT